MNNLFFIKLYTIIKCSCYHYKTMIKTYINSNGKTQIKKDKEIVETYSETKKLNIFSYLGILGYF